MTKIGVVRRTLAAALLAGLTLGGATGAHAAVSGVGGGASAALATSTEFEAHISGLSAEERNAFINENRLVSEEVTVSAPRPDNAIALATTIRYASTGLDVSPMANGCWTGRTDRTGRGGLGQRLYTSYHVGGWCISANTVTSARLVESGGASYGIGWRHEGRVASAAGVRSNQGRSYSQHRFVFGSGGWDVQTVTPCLRVNGLSNATFTRSEVCGIG